MGIIFEEEKTFTPHPLAKSVYALVDENFSLLIYISRIMAIYNKNNVDILELKRQITTVLNNPNLSIDDLTKGKAIDLIVDMYSHKSFGKIRSDILEIVIYKYGPFSVDTLKCYFEPKVLDGGYIVGESGSKCDFVYHCEKKLLIEFIECKADISNVIPRNIAFKDMKEDLNKQKVRYLVTAYYYLKKNYYKPFVYFACYNANYSLELTNVRQNWGHEFVNFINPMEISEIVEKRCTL